MVNFNKGILFLFLLQLKLVAYSQQRTYHVEIANPGQLKAVSSIRVNDIPTTITTPPHISYLTPQVYGANLPITPLTPTNTGGSVPAAIYGQQSVFAGPGPLQNVTGLVAEPDGSLYIANYGDNTVYKVSAAGVISAFAGPSGVGYSFSLPDALVADAAGNLYLSDMANNLIRKITPAGQVSTFAGSGTAGSADNATGLLASFTTPRGMARDAAGNIYVADQANNMIRKISPAGAVTTVTGRAGVGFTNGDIATARFNTPAAVGIDNAGNLYVADMQNGAIRKIAIDGAVSTIATGLNTPRELRVDGTGNIYFVEQGSGNLLRIAANGSVTIIATGFNGPIGLVLDGKGNLYVGAVSLIHKVVISGYTIDKALPAGLSFNPQTGVISGTPTTLWPTTNYTITAYNGGGSHSTSVSITVAATSKKPSIITLPTQQPDHIDANNNYDPKGTSTNRETPIIYTSSNPAVATITATGLVHLVGPGLSTITATQPGNENYADAQPVNQYLTVIENLYVSLPAFETKTVCSADFSANAFIGDTDLPVTYASSNPGVATISSDGLIHIIGAGSTVITISQNTTQQYYVSAQPKSQTLTVVLPVAPDVSIAASYAGNCTGSLVTFTATGHNAGANPVYQWRVNNVVITNNSDVFKSTVLNNGDNVTCTLINNESPCLSGFAANSNIVTLELVSPVTPVVTIAASINYVFPGTEITFTADVKNGSTAPDYQWYVNGIATGENSANYVSNIFANGDLVQCVVAASNHCSLPAESQTLKVTIVTKVEIPNTFTPNADGINDTWFIKGLSGYPNCLVSIYNRNGQLIHRSKGYNVDWDGTTNGKYVPASTYYYVIDLQFQHQVMSGYVTVIK